MQAASCICYSAGRSLRCSKVAPKVAPPGAVRITLLRRYVIPGSLLYGVGVFIVMNFIVLPLSAAPTLPAPPMWLFIEIILEHILLIGLPLGILVQRNASANQ